MNSVTGESRPVRRRVIVPESTGNGAPTVDEQQAEDLLITVDGIISQVEMAVPI